MSPQRIERRTARLCRSRFGVQVHRGFGLNVAVLRRIVEGIARQVEAIPGHVTIESRCVADRRCVRGDITRVD